MKSYHRNRGFGTQYHDLARDSQPSRGFTYRKPPVDGQELLETEQERLFGFDNPEV